MENQENNNTVAKSSIGDLDQHINKLSTAVKEQVTINVKEALDMLTRPQEGIFSEEDFKDRFIVSGSMTAHNLEELGSGAAFFEKNGRLFSKETGGSKNEEQLILRGPRYLAAADINLSIPQKLKIFTEDIEDGVGHYLAHASNAGSPHMELAPVIDYVKNASITLFNAFVQEEKFGIYRLDDSEYQATRASMVGIISDYTRLYYKLLLGKVEHEDENRSLSKETFPIIEKVNGNLLSKFKGHAFSSRSIVRPEASHPLIVLASVAILHKRLDPIDTVVGLPAGSTELACAFSQLGENKSQILLLPISRHSIKKFGIQNVDDMPELQELIKSDHVKELLDHQKVLILDDNASTGESIDIASKFISANTKPESLNCAVSEADLVRISIDLHSEKRKSVASSELLKNAVNILPVSKTLDPKHDLKEMEEKKMLHQYYIKRTKESKNMNDQIMNEVFADNIKNPIDKILKEVSPEQRIGVFQNTFLSNFYVVPVAFEGITYPSVEHAYQRAKFSPEDLKKLQPELIEEIQETLKERGYARKIEDLESFFSDITTTSGNTKVVADILRKYDLVRKDWDDARTAIMIDLLVQKFTDQSLREKLLATENKYLIEGNDWDDTYWGVYDNRGRNMLGRIIMNIREKIRGDKF